MRGVRKDEDFSVMKGGQTEWRWFFRYFCGHRYPSNRHPLLFRKTHTSVNSAQPTAPPPFRLARKARHQIARAVINEKARRQLARANVPNGISCTQGRDITKEQDTRKGRILRKEASRQTEPHAPKGTRCRKTTDWLCGCGFSRPGPVASQFIHRSFIALFIALFIATLSSQKFLLARSTYFFYFCRLFLDGTQGGGLWVRLCQKSI